MNEGDNVPEQTVAIVNSQVMDVGLPKLGGWETGDTERNRWENIVVENLSLGDPWRNSPFPDWRSGCVR